MQHLEPGPGPSIKALLDDQQQLKQEPKEKEWVPSKREVLKLIKLKFRAPVIVVIAFHHYCQPSIWWEQLHQAILWLWVLLVVNSHHKDPDCLPVLDCRCSCLTGVLVHTTFNNRSTWVEPELGWWTLLFTRNQQHQTGTKRETRAKKLDKKISCYYIPSLLSLLLIFLFHLFLVDRYFPFPNVIFVFELCHEQFGLNFFSVSFRYRSTCRWQTQR